MNLDQTIEAWERCNERREALKKEYRDPSKRGQVFKHKTSQLVRDAKAYKLAVEQYGCKHSIWEVRFSLVNHVDVAIKEAKLCTRYIVLYTGVSGDEIEKLVITHHPGAIDIVCTFIKPGTPIKTQ